MAYAQLTIAPVRLISEGTEIKTLQNGTQVACFEFRATVGKVEIPIYANVYGKTAVETHTRVVNAKEGATFLLTGDILLLKADHPKISAFDPEDEMYVFPYMSQPSILQCKPDSKTNQFILVGSSKRETETYYFQNGDAIAKNAYGVYAGKNQNKENVYSYFNFAVGGQACQNFVNLVQPNTPAVIIGYLKASESKGTIYIEVGANKFQKIGYSGDSTKQSNNFKQGYQQSASGVNMSRNNSQAAPAPFDDDSF